MDTKNSATQGVFSYGWDTLKKDFWYFISLSVIYIILSGIATGIDNDSFVMSVLSIIISAWLTAGLLYVTIGYVGGNKREVTDLFGQGKYFLQILLAQIVVGLIVIVGLVFLIVPGIYFAIRFMFVTYLIVDKQMDLSAAMKESSRMTDGIKMDLFIFGLAVFGIAILGLILFGIGIFVAMPVIWLAGAKIYVNLASSKTPVQVTSVE